MRVMFSTTTTQSQKMWPMLVLKRRLQRLWLMTKQAAPIATNLATPSVPVLRRCIWDRMKTDALVVLPLVLSTSLLGLKVIGRNSV